jgi:periplasmic protein CpxP/Spy
MNKKLITITLSLVIAVAAIAQNGERGNWRQNGGAQRKTVEERVAAVHAKFDSTFHFAAEKQAKIDSAFAEQLRAQDALFAEMRAGFTPGQQPDPAVMQAARDKMQEKNKELNIARDEKLQEILGEADYKKWKDELEPAMRPKRGEGRGQGNGGGGDKKPEGQK